MENSMREGLYPKGTLQIYMLKVMKDRVETELEAHKRRLIEEQVDGRLEPFEVVEGNLTIKMSVSQGRKKFDPELAKEVLESVHGKDKVGRLFTRFYLTQKGSALPPRELLEQMKEYFHIEPEFKITEDDAASHLSDTELKDCYSYGDGFHKMTTPAKVSSRELLRMAEDAGVDILDDLF